MNLRMSCELGCDKNNTIILISQNVKGLFSVFNIQVWSVINMFLKWSLNGNPLEIENTNERANCLDQTSEFQLFDLHQ